MNTTHFAFLFPGQGSQTIGMGKELAEAQPAAAELFSRADEILGFNLSDLMWEGPEEVLNDTVNTQPALLTHSAAASAVFSAQFPEVKPSFIAGHSMGELSALLAAGSLDFEQCLKLARKRGELMKKAGDLNPGGMAALIGLDMDKVEKLCQSAKAEGSYVQPANDNCPGQIVVSGEGDGIEKILVSAKEAGARIAVRLPVSIAAHSRLMAPIQEEFAAAVKEAGIKDPSVPIIGNVSAQPLTTKEMIEEDLNAQLTSQVRWTESIEYMLTNGAEHFIEIGTGNVLANLIKRINRKAKRSSIGTPADLIKFQ